MASGAVGVIGTVVVEFDPETKHILQQNVRPADRRRVSVTDIPDLIPGRVEGADVVIWWANTLAEEAWKFYLDNGEHPGIAVRGLNSGVIEYKTDADDLWLEA